MGLLVAVLTIGQSLSLTSFAQGDDRQTSENSSVSISSSGNITLLSIDLAADAQQSDDIGSARSSVVNVDGANPDAAELTKGYSINSEKFDLRNVNGKSYTTPVRSQRSFGTCCA